MRRRRSLVALLLGCGGYTAAAAGDGGVRGGGSGTSRLLKPSSLLRRESLSSHRVALEGRLSQRRPSSTRAGDAAVMLRGGRLIAGWSSSSEEEEDEYGERSFDGEGSGSSSEEEGSEESGAESEGEYSASEDSGDASEEGGEGEISGATAADGDGEEDDGEESEGQESDSSRARAARHTHSHRGARRCSRHHRHHLGRGEEGGRRGEKGKRRAVKKKEDGKKKGKKKGSRVAERMASSPLLLWLQKIRLSDIITIMFLVCLVKVVGLSKAVLVLGLLEFLLKRRGVGAGAGEGGEARKGAVAGGGGLMGVAGKHVDNHFSFVRLNDRFAKDRRELRESCLAAPIPKSMDEARTSAANDSLLAKGDSPLAFWRSQIDGLVGSMSKGGLGGGRDLSPEQKGVSPDHKGGGDKSQGGGEEEATKRAGGGAQGEGRGSSRRHRGSRRTKGRRRRHIKDQETMGAKAEEGGMPKEPQQKEEKTNEEGEEQEQGLGLRASINGTVAGDEKGRDAQSLSSKWKNGVVAAAAQTGVDSPKADAAVSPTAAAAAAVAPKRPRAFLVDLLVIDPVTFELAVSFLMEVADPEKDEIVLRLESPGGPVQLFGHLSSELARLRQAGFELTVCVDKVAASGGYMLAVVGTKIVAAPFAVVGSIGVIAEALNFSKGLKKLGGEAHQFTAGQLKSSIGAFTEVTTNQKLAMRKQIDTIHIAFKDHIRKYRPIVDVETVGTGEVWLAMDAQRLGMVDEISTSSEYLHELTKKKDVYQMKNYTRKLGLHVGRSVFNPFAKAAALGREVVTLVHSLSALFPADPTPSSSPASGASGLSASRSHKLTPLVASLSRLAAAVGDTGEEAGGEGGGAGGMGMGFGLEQQFPPFAMASAPGGGGGGGGGGGDFGSFMMGMAPLGQVGQGPSAAVSPTGDVADVADAAAANAASWSGGARYCDETKGQGSEERGQRERQPQQPQPHSQ